MNQNERLHPSKINKYWRNQIPPQDHINRNNKFEDSYFPPNKNSLLSMTSNGSYVDKENGENNDKKMQATLRHKEININDVIWKRITDLYPDCTLFIKDKDNNNPQIIQGMLGDCYFISFIATFINHRYFVKEKFKTKDISSNGCYEIIFFIDGEWQIVIIDDYVPCYRNRGRDKLLFAKTKANAIWGILLEKAWAKINGGYSNIIGGYSRDVAIALTSYPTEDIMHDNEYKNEDKLYDKIENALTNNNLVISYSKNEKEIKNNGLIPNHAYKIINTCQLQDINSINDKDTIKNIEIDDLQSSKSNPISFTKFYDNFSSTCICYPLYNARIKYFVFEKENYFNNPIIFNLKLEKHSTFYISIFFKYWKFDREAQVLNHPCVCLLFRYDEQSKLYETYGKFDNADISMNIKEELKEGLYVVWIYYYKSQYKHGDKYVVSFASKERFVVDFIGLDEQCNLIKNIIMHKFLEENQNNSNNLINKYEKLNGIKGYIITNYNNTEKNYKFTIEHQNDVILLPPYKRCKEILITIPSKRSLVVVSFGDGVVNLIQQPVNYFDWFKIQFYFERGQLTDKEQIKHVFNTFLNKNIKESENDGRKDYTIKILKVIPQSLVDTLRSISLNLNSDSYYSSCSQTCQMNGTNYQTLKQQYPYEMNLITNKFPPKNNNESTNWIFTKMNNNIIHFGETKDFRNFCGRTVIINEQENYKYIGYCDNNKMNGKGIKMDINNKYIYEGEFVDDKIEGYGKLYLDDNNIWEGMFKNNEQDSVGLQTHLNDSQCVPCVVKYENGQMQNKFYLTQEEQEKVMNIQQDKERLSYFDLIYNDKQSQINDTIYNESLYDEEFNSMSAFIAQYYKREPFIMNQLTLLNKPKDSTIQEVFTCNIKGNDIYIGAFDRNREFKHGRGVYVKDNIYYIGYFKDDNPDEREQFKIFNENKTIKFIGHITKINKDYIPKDGREYYSDGKIKERNVQLYETLIFDKNLYLPQYIFQLNSLFTNEPVYQFQSDNELINQIGNNADIWDLYQTVFEKLYILPQMASTEELAFEVINYSQDYTYIGETYNNKFQGRGCLIRKKDNRYNVGYFKDGRLNGYGYTYDLKWNLIYSGSFKNNYKHGFGTYYYFDENEQYKYKYVGYFQNNNEEGYGVKYYRDGNRSECFFSARKAEGESYYIHHNDYSRITINKNNSKKEITCQNASQSIIDSLFENYNSQYKTKFLELRETDDSKVLQRGFRFFDEGQYIGELNRIGFKHGRGILIYPYTNDYYVGYFKDNKKEGHGTIYNAEHKILYTGNFKNDKPFGKGKYIYANNNELEGEFNETGEGRGVYRFWENNQMNEREGYYINWVVQQ